MLMQQGASDRRNISEWLDNSKHSAELLIEKIESLSERMFKSGNLNIFFLLLCRFTYLDYRNLLLLAAQYPNATDIAGASVWKSMVEKGALFLKEEHQGKGVSLVAPFTEVKGNNVKLIWFTVKMYDISQTNVVNSEYVKTPYIAQRKEHIEILVKAARKFFYEEYDTRYIVTKTDEHIKTGLPCYSKNNLIYIQPKAEETAQLSFLIEHVVRINMDEFQDKEILLYFSTKVRDCLFEIWNLPKQISCSPPYEKITSMEVEKQIIFFDKIQNWVRQIEDGVLYEYRKLAENREIIYQDI